ncbi:MAG: NifX-associated nitrogen fixation protein [Magnetococcus sp. WYHC-3]
MSSTDPILESQFIKELVKQIRALDTYGMQDKQSADLLLAPFVVDREARRQIPTIGDPGPATLARLGAFYNAVAIMIEQECGLMAKPYLNINHEGFGTVLIVVGKLVVLDRVLRDVHRFGFDSLSRLKDEADQLLNIALVRIGAHSVVAGL